MMGNLNTLEGNMKERNWESKYLGGGRLYPPFYISTHTVDNHTIKFRQFTILRQLSNFKQLTLDNSLSLDN